MLTYITHINELCTINKNHMKNILILLLALPLPIIAQKSHFEGVVKFNVVYSSTNPEINVNDYTTFFGDHYISYIKPGYYEPATKNWTIY